MNLSPKNMETMGVYGPGIFRGRKNADNQKLGCGRSLCSFWFLGRFGCFKRVRDGWPCFFQKRLGGMDGDCGNQLGLNSFLPPLSYKKLRPNPTTLWSNLNTFSKEFRKISLLVKMFGLFGNRITGWCFQPISKIWSSTWVHLPQIGMKTKKYLSCHHLVNIQSSPLSWMYPPPSSYIRCPTQRIIWDFPYFTPPLLNGGWTSPSKNPTTSITFTRQSKGKTVLHFFQDALLQAGHQQFCSIRCVLFSNTWRREGMTWNEVSYGCFLKWWVSPHFTPQVLIIL